MLKINSHKNSIKFLLTAAAFLISFAASAQKEIVCGADRPDQYLSLLEGKAVAVVANQTSTVGNNHLVDFLKRKRVDIKKVFAPEHGFRGDEDAGAEVKDTVDKKTKLPVISLYGDNKKPTSAQLADVDVIVFDIQDVGVRFYTYISTLHLVMEAAAENGKQVVVLDRPNPNGYYIDGPILEEDCKSFVGMHPVPIVYGMTIGEYARMIDGEGWLAGGKSCDLTVVSCEGYSHKSRYSLPIPPSPNLPNDKAINLYPSVCLFEGTTFSVGRGTPFPFQVFGSPNVPDTGFFFIPMPTDRGDKNPKLRAKKCNGFDLRKTSDLNGINLEWLIWANQHYSPKGYMFTRYFRNLAGTTRLEQQIKAGMTAEQIRETWQTGLDDFKKIRAKYLLYKDF